MKKIITVLLVLMFSFGVVGTAIACGGCPTSCANFWESFFQGKYVASSTSYPVESSSSYPDNKYPEYDHDKYSEYDYDKYSEYDHN